MEPLGSATMDGSEIGLNFNNPVKDDPPTIENLVSLLPNLCSNLYSNFAV